MPTAPSPPFAGTEVEAKSSVPPTVAPIIQTATAVVAGAVYTPATFAAALAECKSMANGSTITRDDGRLFINLPRGFYPDGGTFRTVGGSAWGTAVGNAGEPGFTYQATGECWSAYYEIVGEGTADYVADSPVSGTPPYIVHFVLTLPPSIQTLQAGR